MFMPIITHGNPHTKKDFHLKNRRFEAVVQWYNTCLTFIRPQIQSHQKKAKVVGAGSRDCSKVKRNGSEAKTTGCSSRGPAFYCQNTYSNSKLPANLIPGNLISSPDLHKD